MSAPRKSLTERIGFAAAKAAAEEPRVKIPPADPAAALPAATNELMASIQRVIKERNDALKNAANLYQHNQHLFNTNIKVREDANYSRSERDLYMRVIAEIGTDITTGFDILGRVVQKLSQCAALVQRMPAPPQINNSPDMPPVGINGLPDEEPEPQFDASGVPYNQAAKTVSNQQINEMIAKLEEEHA